MRLLVFLLVILAIASPVRALTVVLDYSYDQSYFAGNPTAKSTLIKAAADLSEALTNYLNAELNGVPTDQFVGTIANSELDFTWDLTFVNPEDVNGKVTRDSISAADDEFTVYVGSVASIAGDHTLGEGGPVQASYQLSFAGPAGAAVQNANALLNGANLSSAFLARGAGPTVFSYIDSVDLGSGPIDYTIHVGELGGFLTFAKANEWHFDWQTPCPADKYDFYTVMLHEMIHALGLGSTETWNNLVSGADWTGPNAVAANGGSGVGLIHEFYDNDPGKPDGGHVADGVMSKTYETNADQVSVMTAGLAKGERRKITLLDLAFLKDIGYGPATEPPTLPAPPTPTPTPTPTSTPTSTSSNGAALSAPILVGKSTLKTTKSRVKLGGVVVAPGAVVLYKIGKGKFLRAKGGAKWKISAKLKPGKNVIQIVTFDPATGVTSKAKKVIVVRADT